MSFFLFFFFFSSRRRHTRCSRDWSSDVCSSDLVAEHRQQIIEPHPSAQLPRGQPAAAIDGKEERERPHQMRSEERRVGKSVDLGGRRIIKKKKKKQARAGDRRKEEKRDERNTGK